MGCTSPAAAWSGPARLGWLAGQHTPAGGAVQCAWAAAQAPLAAAAAGAAPAAGPATRAAGATGCSTGGGSATRRCDCGSRGAGRAGRAWWHIPRPARCSPSSGSPCLKQPGCGRRGSPVGAGWCSAEAQQAAAAGVRRGCATGSGAWQCGAEAAASLARTSGPSPGCLGGSAGSRGRCGCTARPCGPAGGAGGAGHGCRRSGQWTPGVPRSPTGA